MEENLSLCTTLEYSRFLLDLLSRWQNKHALYLSSPPIRRAFELGETKHCRLTSRIVKRSTYKPIKSRPKSPRFVQSIIINTLVLKLTL